jgi:Holliday junction DNA helicase RuvA
VIGKLRGVIDSYGEDFVIVDVQGVGYVVHCSTRTLQHLPQAGEATTLSIETHVREDMIRLYGFRSDAEREWFRLLQTVQGVGAKVALGILSVLDPGAIANAIATGDKTAVSRGPGVGPKLAARIVAELKDKAPAFRQRRSGADPPRRDDRGQEGAAAGQRRRLGARPSRLRAGAGLRGDRRRAQAGRRRG